MARSSELNFHSNMVGTGQQPVTAAGKGDNLFVGGHFSFLSLSCFFKTCSGFSFIFFLQVYVYQG